MLLLQERCRSEQLEAPAAEAGLAQADQTNAARVGETRDRGGHEHFLSGQRRNSAPSCDCPPGNGGKRSCQVWMLKLLGESQPQMPLGCPDSAREHALRTGMAPDIDHLSIHTHLVDGVLVL